MMNTVGRGRFRYIGPQQNQIPIWFMRQAGRYLPEYQAFKKERCLHELFGDREAIRIITLQPLARFDLDAAIVFADILSVVPALGQELRFEPHPVLSRPLQTLEDLQSWLEVSTEERCERVHFCCAALYEAIRDLKAILEPMNKTLIGFSGAPWTIFTYLLTGKPISSIGWVPFRGFVLDHLPLIHSILSSITGVVIEHLKQQIQAGIDCFQIFESHSDFLSDDLYEILAFPYVCEIFRAFPDQFGLFFPGPSSRAHTLGMHSAFIQGLSVHWTQSFSTVVREQIKIWPEKRQVLQGNLDPAVLFSGPHNLKESVSHILKWGCKNPGGFIFNLGHGIHPHTPLESVESVIHEVRKMEISLRGEETEGLDLYRMTDKEV